MASATKAKTKSKPASDEISPDEIKDWPDWARAESGRRKGRRSGPASPATRIPELETVGALRGEGRDLPLKLIGRSPFQTRLIFDEQELRNLAATIAVAGVLQPIIVRPKGQRYELVAGERRLRAAKIAKLEKIPAVVRKLDDGQARELAAIENLQRKDLNPIEEARAFGELLKGVRGKGSGVKGKGEGKITQEELARRLGVSQPHVANRLRLLGLPAAWQQRIISGEITATNARCLLPYKDHPGLMQGIEKAINHEFKHHPQPTSEEFESTVKFAVHQQTRPMSARESRWNSRLGGYPKPFQPTQQEREELKLIEVPDYQGKPVQRACNVKLWDKLEKAHVNKVIQRRDKERKAKGKRGKTKKGEPKNFTPAEKKRLEQRDRERARKQTWPYARRLWDWKINWLRYLIHAAIGDPGGFESENLLRLLLYFSAAPLVPAEVYRRGNLLKSCLRSRAIRVPLRHGLHDLWKGIGELQNADFVDDAARYFLAGMFYDAKQGPAAIVPEEDVAAIADFLCIDVQKLWKKEQAGPLSESYWNLHTKEQLVELAKELKFKLDASAPKTQMVKAFLQHKTALPLPKEIAKIKRPR